MKASSTIISAIFFLSVLATTCLATSVFDMGGNPIERRFKCVMRARKLKITEDLLTVYKGTVRQESQPAFVQLHKDILSGNHVTFHPKAAADLNVDLTTLAPYGIAFKGSESFWKLDTSTKNCITQTGRNISDSGTFVMEEVENFKVDYKVYKLVYHPGSYEVGMEYFTGGDYNLVALGDKLGESQSRIIFSFTWCHA